MDTMLASPKQHEFFGDLSKLPDLVLATKNAELCSVNAHGSFVLCDISWPTGKQETLIAFCQAPDAKPLLTKTGEPIVHLHVDWRTIRHVLVRSRINDLIKTTHEIALSSSAKPADRVIWFYTKETAEFTGLEKSGGIWPI